MVKHGQGEKVAFRGPNGVFNYIYPRPCNAFRFGRTLRKFEV